MYSLLELRHLSKNYPPQSVLSDIQLELQTGKILGLLGESGSGKSTLLRLAAGLIDPDEGEIWLNGEKLRLASDQLIPGHPDIKIVHQDYNLSLPISVRENIAYALRYYQKAVSYTHLDVYKRQVQTVEGLLNNTLGLWHNSPPTTPKWRN